MSRHCLKQVASALLLACASATVMAQTGRNASANGEGTCSQLEHENEAATAKPGAKAAVVRGKYAKPSAPAVRDNGGGGGEGDGAMPRSNASKWHSFLPGMFR